MNSVIKYNAAKSKELAKVLKKSHPVILFKGGICIIDLKNKEEISVNADRFSYPASVYKIFIAAEVLRQVEIGNLDLNQKITVKHPNGSNDIAPLYPKDTYPLLKAGDSPDIDTLLSLMMEQSDNIASNTLIDLIRYESIIKNIIHEHGWQGSEISHKFLNQVYKQRPYRFSDTTLTCPRHLAEFMQRAETDMLVSPFVSKMLRQYMNKQRQQAVKKPSNHNPSYWLTNLDYGKNGWLETNPTGFVPKLKAILRNIGILRFQCEVGIVKTEKEHYAIAVMSKYRVFNSQQHWRLASLSADILKLIKK